jgi:hypothetical protein
MILKLLVRCLKQIKNFIQSYDFKTIGKMIETNKKLIY